MRYARIANNVVAEIISLPDSVNVSDAFHPEIVASLVVCEDLSVQEGWLFEDGDIWLPPIVSPTNVIQLPELIIILQKGVDAAAETERLRYITPGNGQAMTYQQKVAEAQAFKAAATPKASDYPMLSSEVGITADTLDAVADIVLAAFAQWQQIGAMIESIRLGAKRDINAADDEATARAIVDAIEWPHSAL